MKPRSGALRSLLNVGQLVAGVASAVSGFLIQFCYHMGHGASGGVTRIVWGWGYATWALFHQLASAAMLAIAVWHLYLNRKPLLALLKRAGAWRRQGPIFFATFAFAALTALAAWTVAGASGNRLAEHGLVEIHDKVVIPMSVLLALHIWQRRSRLLPRTGHRGR